MGVLIPLTRCAPMGIEPVGSDFAVSTLIAMPPLQMRVYKCTSNLHDKRRMFL